MEMEVVTEIFFSSSARIITVSCEGEAIITLDWKGFF